MFLSQFNTDVSFLAFILRCDCSSEAFAVLSDYFHNIKTITTVIICIGTTPFHFGKESYTVPTAQSCRRQFRVPRALEDVFQRKDQNNNLKTKECTQIIELSKRVCLGFFPFPFTRVHMCVYAL